MKHSPVHHVYLGSLSLPGASWACRGPSEFQVQGTCEREVASVSEGGNDQSARVPQVLIAVDKLSVHCSH